MKRSRMLGWLMIGLVIGAVVTQLVTATFRTDATVDAIRNSQQSNYQVLQTVTDCTTPGRDCYERSQRRLAAAIASINQITILAASCAAGNVRTASEIEECVLRRLEREGKSPRNP